MAGLLGDIYSYIDSKKRGLLDAVQNPGDALSQFVGNMGDNQNQTNALMQAAGYGLLGKPQTSVLADSRPSVGYDQNPRAVTPQQSALARALLAEQGSQMGANMAGMLLYHGSNSAAPIKQIKDSGVFGGIFASPSKTSAASHGDSLYRMTVPDSQIMNVGDEVPWDKATGLISKNIHKESPHAEEIADMVVNGRSAFDSSIPEDELLHALRTDNVGEADWELQRLRGLLAKDNGYKAVQMPDEHGMSYLVLPGTTPRPYRK